MLRLGEFNRLQGPQNAPFVYSLDLLEHDSIILTECAFWEKRTLPQRQRFDWSGRGDSNARPPAAKSCVSFRSKGPGRLSGFARLFQLTAPPG